jgi:toxin YoeB
MNITFTETAWKEYLEWQKIDKKVLKKINDILEDISRNGHQGIGKPEALKHELAGLWSRRITLEHRIIYSIKDEVISIISCRGHYN